MSHLSEDIICQEEGVLQGCALANNVQQPVSFLNKRHSLNPTTLVHPARSCLNSVFSFKQTMYLLS